MDTNLPSIPEPVKIKEYALKKAEKWIKQGIDEESALRYFLLNPQFLPKYLWKYLKKHLLKKGIVWAIFLKKLGKCRDKAIEWAKGSTSWEEFLKCVYSNLESEEEGEEL